MVETAQKLRPGAQDWFNFIAAGLNCNYQLNCILYLDCYIDKEVLAEAIRLLIREEPVLGSRFVIRDNEAYWEPRSDLSEKDFLSVIPAPDMEEEIRKFVNRPINEGVDPLFHVCVLRGNASDTLCIKISHSCADGRGTKDFTERLNEIYNLLASGQDVLVKRKTGVRDQKKLFHHIPAEKLAKSLFFDEGRERISCEFPYLNQKAEKGLSAFAIKYLPEEEFKRCRHFGKQYGATVNDLFVTALFRAIWSLDNLPEMKKTSIGCTVDLRQYIPEKTMNTICNLSSMFEIVVEKNTDAPFHETLKQVVKETKRLKELFLGADFPFIYEVLFRIGFEQMYRHIVQDRPEEEDKNSSPFIFSNIGVIGNGEMTWGPATVRRLFMTGPALNPPMSLFVAATYADVTALTFAYSKLSATETLVEAFLELVLEELKSLE